jgi:UDP-glucose 4-epimerase
MKKIALVTGGAGFLGSHLVDHLMKNDYHVRVIDNFSTGRKTNLEQWKNNPHFELLEKDILDLKEEEPFFKNVELVFHLASIDNEIDSLDNPSLYTTVNLLGTIKILECSRYQKIKKFIYTSTHKIYGSPNTPTLETDPPNPLTPYAFSKISAERAIKQWSFNFKIPINILRVADAYGPRCQYPAGYFASYFDLWIGQKIHNLPLTIIGSQDDKWDLIYCTDVANACLALANLETSKEVYNIGTSKPIVVGEIIQKISNNFKILPSLKRMPTETWLDTSNSGFKTLWSPKISFEHGIKFTMATTDDWRDSKPWSIDNIKSLVEKWNNSFISK